MANGISQEKIDKLLVQFGDVLGAPILKVTRPGGEDRPIYRVYMHDKTVIVADRKDGQAARTEREVLARLGGLTDRVPQILAYADGLTYLSDCGTERLSIALYRARPKDRLALVLDAIDALGEMHRAAAGVDWTGVLKPLGLDRDWTRHFARGPQRLAKMVGLPVPDYDIDALEHALGAAPSRFVKWDSRAANATLDASGRLHWIDFEHAGLRHGAEDYAWLICDEVFPLNLAEHFPVIRDRIARAHPPDVPDPVRMVEIFGALQASLRLRVIVTELKKKSWTPQREILALDLVGADPYMAERLACNGAYLSSLNQETQGFSAVFAALAQQFNTAHSNAPKR